MIDGPPHHVPVSSQTRSGSDRDHQERDPRRRLRGQVHRQEVSWGCIKKILPNANFCTFLKRSRLFCFLLKVLLGLPRPLQPGGGASLSGARIHLSEGSTVVPEELRQRRVSASVRPLVFVLSGESEVRNRKLSL